MDKISLSFEGVEGRNQMGLIWEQAKSPLIVPLLKLLVTICLGMSIMLFVERLYMGVVILLVKIFGRKPEKRYNWEPLKDDLELANSNYPMVLVQIPMYNEKEVPLYFTIFYNIFLISLAFLFYYEHFYEC